MLALERKGSLRFYAANNVFDSLLEICLCSGQKMNDIYDFKLLFFAKTPGVNRLKNTVSFKAESYFSEQLQKNV